MPSTRPGMRTRKQKAGSDPGLFFESSFRGAQSVSPESITTIGSMDSGPAPRGASRNDDVMGVRFLLRRVERFVQGGIVGVALGVAAVEGCLVRHVERRAALQALDQVGIGDER